MREKIRYEEKYQLANLICKKLTLEFTRVTDWGCPFMLMVVWLFKWWIFIGGVLSKLSNRIYKMEENVCANFHIIIIYLKMHYVFFQDIYLFKCKCVLLFLCADGFKTATSAFQTTTITRPNCDC